MIPVAILSDADFDATTVDPDTVQFGPAGAEYNHRRTHVKDADDDGDLDLVMHFRTQNTGIQLGDTEACLTGATLDGTPILGCDSVRIVGALDDGDVDSWGDAEEASVAADQLRACPRNSKHDAWPPDTNNDGEANLTDTELFQGHFETGLGEPGYDERFDLLFDGDVNLLDLLAFKPSMGVTCSEANPDADGDGFRNEEEMFVGTDPLTSCGILAWPPDFTDDSAVNLTDFRSLKPHFMSEVPDPHYSYRHDLNTNGAVNLLDVLPLKAHFNTRCD